MGTTYVAKPSVTLLSAINAPVFAPAEWVPIVLDLYRGLRQWLIRKVHTGMYEMLDYDCTLELVDSKGKLATFKRHQKVKFLQDNVIAFQDYAWGQGELFARYKVSPGVEVDRYRDGDRWNVLISLRETKSRGDIEDFYIERTVRNGFTKDQEWRQVEVRHQTRRLRLATIFPKNRHCQRAILLQRSRNRTTVLDREHFSELPDGRQVLTWETHNITRLEIYTIRWSW
jgi:hypothetical protein